MTSVCDRRTALTLFGGAAVAPLASRAAPGTVTIIEAKSIITMEPAQPRARFVAIADGLILGLADRREELDLWTRNRTIIEERRMRGAYLMPGFIDPHIHPMQAAVMLNLPFLAPEDWDLPSGFYPGATTPDAYRQRLNAALAQSSATPFVCWGHHELFHGPIDRKELDQIAPDRPVVIWQRSFHEIIVNSAMLRAWKLDNRPAFEAALAAAKVDPTHGDFDKGIFAENALLIPLDKLRSVLLAPERLKSGFAALQRLLLTSGVTTTSDMGTGIFASFDVEAGLIRAAFERPDNPSRTMLMPLAHSIAKDTDPNTWLSEAVSRYSSPRVRVDARVKILVDGAFFAQSMMMNPPGYSDGHLGKWITPPDVAQEYFNRFWNAGFSLHIHVNGDAGLDAVLGALATLPSRRGKQTITLEHLGYSTEAQNREIARMGLMVSAQPNYIRVLGDAYASHGLGPDRAATMNRLGSLERKSVPLGLHSDFNMAPIDPLYLAWVATNRQTLGGSIKAPAERLSLDKALRAITIEAAQVIGMDAMVGSIAAGKRADFAVLDQDPYQLGAQNLRRAKVQGVVFEGQYRAR